MKKQPTIIKKAYSVIDPTIYDDCQIYTTPLAHDDPEIFYAETPGEAKRQLRDFSEYINIICKRAKNHDIVVFEDQQVKRYEIKRIEEDRAREYHKKRIIGMLERMPEDFTFLMQDSRTFVGNSVMWHRKDHKGYTTNPMEAHIFNISECIQHIKNGRDTDVLWATEHVMSKIIYHVDMQYLNYEFRFKP